VKRSPMRAVSDKRRRRDAVYPERRKQVAARGGDICEYCEVAPMTDVHHLAGRVGPDPHALANLIGLCRDCHARAHGEPEWARSVGLMRSRVARLA